mmetsp:Transcript_94821/g.187831  ORF Transcript_94821/g.187831 Transcript_94821/m.187831 type:complete len:200 (-) Transcript_94821:388-987(-)
MAVLDHGTQCGLHLCLMVVLQTTEGLHRCFSDLPNTVCQTFLQVGHCLRVPRGCTSAQHLCCCPAHFWMFIVQVCSNCPTNVRQHHCIHVRFWLLYLSSWCLLLRHPLVHKHGAATPKQRHAITPCQKSQSKHCCSSDFRIPVCKTSIQRFQGMLLVSFLRQVGKYIERNIADFSVVVPDHVTNGCNDVWVSFQSNAAI